MLRAGTFEPAAAGAATVPTREVEVALDGVAATEHVGFEEVQDTGVDITKAPFLFSIGRGVEDKDEIPRFEALAERFGATLSVSRPLVDAGWMPSARQVGQSGKTVKPRVYLALGISGAVQHLAGMRTAETIIAVNTDPEAPIFGSRTTAPSPTCSRSPTSSSKRWNSSVALLFAATKTRPVFWDFTTVAEGPLVRARGDLGDRVPVRRAGGRSGATAAATEGRGRRSRGASSRAAWPPGAGWCSHTARSSGATTRPGRRTG